MKNIFIFVIGLGFLQNAFAVMPPMSPDELEKNSNQIVVGRVIKVACTGIIHKHFCGHRFGYVAGLEVSKIIKGKKTKNIPLYFTKANFKTGCTGPVDTLHYEGEAGTYFLRCQEDLSRCALTHYDGVQYSKQAATSLPKCSGN